MTLLTSTDPDLEQSFSLDLPAALTQAGFECLRVTPCDPRHRVMVAQKAP